jgi:hypothetical protein
MKRLFIALAVGLLAIAAFGWWRYSSLFPKVSQESVLLTPEKRSALERLRQEDKFEPHELPPAGYTGIASPEDGVLASSAVNNVIDSVLSEPAGPISSITVSDLIGREMKRVNLLDTEDRDRTGDYMIEIWYLLGFRGATGRFASGAAFQPPEGYGEPLPPGWKSPTEPRPMSDH